MKKEDLSALVPYMATLLKPYFLSSSTLTPPHAQGTTGNRTISLTNNQPENQIVPLIANGSASQAVVTFKNTYTSPPNVQLTVINHPSSTGTVHLTAAPGTTGCILESTDTADTRQVMVTVFGNIVP